ncbi:AT-rich interactive domain-containing protein 4B isoform X4 [Aquarana catesbeiana]|uniref:AT-rich interactive domain-containing protein 4B isoform X4 n=1 Tax=Aquarana catesbeiana TaxID=8400 RepID=UPI003CC9EB3B
MVTGAPLCADSVTVPEDIGDGGRKCPGSAQRHMYKTGNLNSPKTLPIFSVNMKSVDEPPFLSVGTDVSAKYRGAFCEAKIKSTKRLVKVKVTFRRDATAVEVQDDHVRGPLKIGAVVEIKRPDGTYQEAVINKLTDASWYTVVFDDGDEKTLRRSSLCLKGERHFAESQTLDQLPLTNPEHFGTPVIGKKSSRGRRSNHIPEDESSTSSSDEDDDKDKTGDKLQGKVVYVSLSTEGKKNPWVPALVVSPECCDDIAVKKDFIFARSFKDGKFFSVGKADIRDIGDISLKTDCILKPAFDHAMEFIKNKAIPTTWKSELIEESSSNETEEEDGETKDDQENSNCEDEEEVEPFPDEGENFLQQLYKFMEDRGTPINKKPVLGYRNLNLFTLFRLVHELGGFNNIDSGAVWKQVYQDLGIPVLNSAAGYNVKCAYKKYLYGFEEYCSSTNICFHMDLPKKIPKSSKDNNLESTNFLKQETTNDGNIEESSVKNDCCVKNDTSVLNEEAQNLDTEIDVPFPCAKEPKGLYENLSVQDKNDLNESAQEPKVDNTTKKKGVISFLKSNDEVEENTNDEVEDNEEEAFKSGTPSIKPYVQYDEWMKDDKTHRPADKSVPKVKHRRKIKNKSEAGRNRSISDKDENISKQCKLFSRPLFQSCDNESSFDCNDSRNSAQGLLKHLEIASILNGLQATELYEDSIKLDQKMNKNEKDFNMSNIKNDLAARAEGKRSQGTEGSYSRVDKFDCKATQEGSSDETDYKLEASRRKKFVTNFDKIAKSPIKSSKRKFISCGKGLNASINDESISCKEITDRFDADIIMSSDEEEQPKPKVPLLQKCNGLDDKKQKLQTARLYTSLQDMSDKKAKTNSSEERLRAKDPKDVWSSIQGQWPKKTLKELFSDSDTEGASSPHHKDLEDTPNDSTFQSVNHETRDLSVEFLKPIIHTIELKPADKKMVELGKNKVDLPSNGSNSVLNTPPTTPESISSRIYRRSQLTFQIFEHAEANHEEVESKKSENTSATELDSVTCELQGFQFEGNLSLTGFEVGINSNSSNHLERESKEKVNTSDSEDLSGGESLAKVQSSKAFPEVAPRKTSSGMSPPGKYVENKDPEMCQKEYSDHLPKVYKWSFHLSDLENLTTVERITFLQEKLQEVRKHYLSLKSEVASIDRRRKHSKKKEREGAVLSTMSPSSNSVTAAVMLTLAEPSLSTSSQNAVVVECR